MNTSFTANTITINGTTYQAGYSVTPKKTVFAFVELDGKTTRIGFKPGSEFYADALAAATGISPEDAARDVADLIDMTTVESPEPVKPVENAQDKPTADKSEWPWIGTSIKGKGWEIYFDPGYEKTRVIFKKPPTPGVKELVKEFGFYWSPTLKSWNKGLNHKAHRAAEKLAAYLRYYPEKPMFV